MGLKHYMFLVVVTAWSCGYNCFLLNHKLSPCPQNCSCESSTVHCVNKSYSNVPPLPPMPNHVWCETNMNHNQITTIQPAAFKNQTNCTTCHFEFNNNHIHTIKAGAFDGVTDCLDFELYLSYNNLTSIPSAIQVLKHLEILFLNGNPLKQLDASVMSAIGQSLNSLVFDMNGFDSWPYQLHYLRKLQILRVGQIPFKNIPGNSFHGLEHTLNYLDIHESQLTKIPRAICDLRNLIYMNVSSNYYLNEDDALVVESCVGNRLNLDYLIMDGNNIELFPSLFRMFYNINQLYMKNGVINTMIGDLFLSQNFSTKMLFLDGNKFTRIPYGLNQFTSLTSLNFANNLITGIDESDVSKLVNLIFLKLEGNPLLYISQKSFENNVNLVSLDVGRTKLFQIPPAVMYLSKLMTLMLDGDPIDCTCDLAYLKTWNYTGAISDSSLCYLSNEKIKDYLTNNLPGC